MRDVTQSSRLSIFRKRDVCATFYALRITLKVKSAGVFGNKFFFRSGILSAIRGAKFVD
jgi:hypothetical protein